MYESEKELEFTDSDLMEIIRKPDEWSREEYLHAKNVLKEKGRITDEEITLLKIRRIEESRLPEKASASWITVGFLFAVMGGLFGIVFGLMLMTLKKKDITGKGRYFVYDGKSRALGQTIFITGALCFIMGFIYLLIKNYIG